jgi:hypothetical protein
MVATVVLLESLWKGKGMGCVIGEAGMGKTFSIATGLTLNKQIDYVYISFPPESTARLVSQKLVEALSGEAATKIERNEILRLRATSLLRSRQPMVIVDEAQNLDRQGIENLRYLHDVCSCSFPILLSGGDGCWEVLSAEKMLESRIHEYVAHRRLCETDVVDILPNYHPLWTDADPELIRHIDARRCRGEFRRWAGFTAKAELEVDASPDAEINEDLVDSILATLPP